MEIFVRILSAVSNPFLIPFYGFVLLFTFTYLNIMPIQYIAFVLSIVFTFTLLAPTLFIGLSKWMNKWTIKEVCERKRRFIPYVLTMMSYATCLLTMYKMHIPRYFAGIIIAALISMTICMLINLRWIISIHLTGCGLLTGGLLSYSLLFYFNPVWWLCGFILLSGVQGTVRIIFYQHSLLEVILGFIVGMFCGIIGILFI